MASTRNFQRQRENAIQYAIGRPTTARIAIVTADRRTLTQIAVQSTLIPGKEETVFLQDGAPAFAEQKGAHGASRLDVGGRPQDDASLVQLRVQRRGHLPE